MDSKVNYKKGSFFERALALIIDSALLAIVIIPLSFLLQSYPIIALVIEFLLVATYFVFFDIRSGSTIGKKVLRLKVVNTGYNPVDIKHAIIRELIGKFISQIIFSLGYIWVLNDQKRQAWHDKLAKTYVVKLNKDGTLDTISDQKINILSRIIFFLLAVPITITVVSGIFFGLVGKPVKMIGNSMEPTYKNGEILAARKLALYKRGDVIAFKAIANRKVNTFIKRVVAVQGDSVEIKDGVFLLNGKKLDSKYLASNSNVATGPFMKNGVTYNVPKGSGFVLSDTPNLAADSRVFGFIPKAAVVGKITLCYLNCGK